jgi:multidrug efflux pump subunit AcrA (membrane-fusion protein)
MTRARIKAFVVGLLILGGGIGGFFALTSTKPTAEVRDDTASKWRVSTEQVTLGRVSPEFNGFATVQNPDIQTLKARLTTDVESLRVREGARVTEGTLMATLDPIDAEINLSRVRASLADARASLANLNATEAKDREALTLDQEALTILEQSLTRVNDLQGRNLASQQDIDEARRAVVQQKLQVNRRQLALETVDAKRAQLQTTIERFAAEARAAERDLASTRVVAPADGQVVSVHVVAGDRVQANQDLLTFAPDAGRELRVQVPSQIGLRLARALASQTPVVAQTANGDQVELTRVAGQVRDNTGSLDVFFRGASILPPTNTVVSISIALEAEERVAVLPTDALYGGNLIYRITDEDTLEALEVERLGQRPAAGETQVLVRSPALSSGDRILTSRLPAAVTGLSVEVIE